MTLSKTTTLSEFSNDWVETRVFKMYWSNDSLCCHTHFTVKFQWIRGNWESLQVLTVIKTLLVRFIWRNQLSIILFWTWFTGGICLLLYRDGHFCVIFSKTTQMLTLQKKLDFWFLVLSAGIFFFKGQHWDSLDS